MGIYIKGMEMPDNCVECPLETDYGTCGYYSLFVEAGHDSEVWKRRDDCPLVEVPPHGRLIDADALTTVTEMVNGEWKTYVEVFEVADAPTIIESEEEDG